MKKSFCITLDIEKDYGRVNQYLGLKRLSELISLFDKLKLKPTFFVSTQVLQKKSEILTLLKNQDVQPHGHTHNLSNSNSTKKRIKEIKTAKEVYCQSFRRNPLGYRAPQGVISAPEVELLKKEGFAYDASVFPSLRPGVFNNLSSPRTPFYYPNGILEIPFSTIFVFPLALSYLQLLGWGFYQSLFNWLPRQIVFDFHLHNLYHNQNFKHLPFKMKLIYSRNKNKGLAYFEKFVGLLQTKGYLSITMADYYQQLKKELTQ